MCNSQGPKQFFPSNSLGSGQNVSIPLQYQSGTQPTAPAGPTTPGAPAAATSPANPAPTPSTPAPTLGNSGQPVSTVPQSIAGPSILSLLSSIKQR